MASASRRAAPNSASGAESNGECSLIPLLLHRAQYPTQRAAAMEHIGFHRAFRDPQQRRDLGLRIPFSIEQHHRQPLPLRQRGECGAQPLTQVDVSCLARRVVPGRRRDRIQGIRRPDPPSTSQVARRVDYDLHQPWPEGLAGIVPRDRPPGGEKSLLGGIVGVFPILKNRVGDAASHRLVYFDQRPEGVGVALARPGSERHLVHARHTRPLGGTLRVIRETGAPTRGPAAPCRRRRPAGMRSRPLAWERRRKAPQKPEGSAPRGQKWLPARLEQYYPAGRSPERGARGRNGNAALAWYRPAPAGTARGRPSGPSPSGSAAGGAIPRWIGTGP